MPDVDTPESKIGNKVPLLSSFFRFLAGHRGWFHSVFAAAVFSALLWYFAGLTYGTAFFIGYAAHLAIDAFTKSGINFLHPISNFRISGFITTGGFSENLLLVGIVIVDVWKIVELLF